MNINHFLKVFQNSTNLLNSSELTKLEIDFSVGIYLDSVFLKLYKKEWGNNFSDPLNANTRIFFSVWVSNKTLLNDKLFYNIHAFKLRDLKVIQFQAEILLQILGQNSMLSNMNGKM